MSLQEELVKGINDFLINKGVNVTEQPSVLQQTKKEFEGDYTFVLFPYLKTLKTNPNALGEELGQFLTEKNLIAGYNLVKGFLNLSLNESIWKSVFSELQPGKKLNVESDTVMVEYSSPNTNKPLHLGHLRNNFLGFSLSNILDANGYNVIKANLINDRGIHICKSMLAYMKFGDNETPESSGLKGDHLVGKYYVIFDKKYKEQIEALIAEGKDADVAKKEAPLLLEAQEMLKKWEDEDPEIRALWEKMNNWVYSGFEKTYKSIGVAFDQYYYESDTYLLGKDIVEEGLEKGVFFKKDNNSVWADLSDEGLDEKLVLRGDGTSVYITQDMGTADLKYNDYKVDKSIYVVGNEQDYHFDVLKRIMKKLGKPYADGIYHMSYGMVDLPSGKMKSREGTVVDADDLINDMVKTARQRTNELGKIDGFTEEEAEKLYHMLALGAVKYFILKVDPKKRMLFNPEESIDFQGNTGPFIQYTHARIASVIRRAKQLGFDFENVSAQNYPFSSTEKELIQLIELTEEKIKEAGKAYAPSIVANHVYEIAKTFNRFYSEQSILNAENPEDRLVRIKLCEQVASSVKFLMGLLGIDVPEKM